MKPIYFLKKILFSSIILLLLSTIITANSESTSKKTVQSNPLTIKGDMIVFEKAVMEVTARGKVKLLYNGYEVDSDEVKFSQVDKYIKFSSRLTLRSEEIIATADSFNYNLDTFEGKARRFRGKIDRLLISGEKFIFSKDKIIIYDALFTTCQKDHWTHYNVKSKKIYLYPQLGFFVSISNKITISALPFSIPIPTYFYGAPRYGVLGQSTLFPVFGSNKIEGQYIKERIGYFISDKSSGTVELGTTEKLGVVGGVTHAFLLSKKNKIQGRTYYAGTDGMTGHVMVQRRLLSRDKKEKEKKLAHHFLKKFQLAEKEMSIATIWVKHREMLNDYRVSFLPVGVLDFKNIPLSIYKLSFDNHIAYGKYSEERGISSDDDRDRETFTSYKSSLYTSLSRKYMFSKRVSLKTSGYFYGYWYNTGNSWRRTFAKTSLKFKWPLLNPKLSYTKRIFNRGTSPFRHDKAYAIETDEIGLEISRDFRYIVLASEINYDIENYDVRTWDIKAGIKLHCWQLNILLKPHQNGVGFGIDIY